MKPRIFSGFLEKKIFFCILKGEMHKIHIFFPEKYIIKKMYVPTLRTVTQNTRIFLFGLAVIFYSFFCCLLIFFIYISTFRKYHQSVRQFGSRSGPSPETCRHRVDIPHSSSIFTLQKALITFANSPGPGITMPP